MDRGGETLHQSPSTGPIPGSSTIQHLSHPHYSPGVPILSSPKHSESRATKINSMYFETKTNMLEIIEEGLQLKLEIQGIKEQFLSLLNNFEEFEKKDPNAPEEMTTPKSSTAQKGISAARARVRALYEARKARMAAKRAASKAGDDSALPPSKYAKVDKNDDNKENVPSPRVTRESRRRSSSAATTPFSMKSHGSCACHPRSVLKKLLTPIKEEKQQDQCLKCSQRRGHGKPQSARRLEGEYVMLKSPAIVKDIGDYVTLASSPLPSPPPAPFQTPVSNLCNTPEDTSIWDDTMQDVADRSDITVELSSKEYSSPEKPTLLESPVKYARSDDINDLYTATKSPRDLRDVSLISKISRTSLREQVSSCNLSGAFHSTFNYPLHSTLNYPMHSTMDISDIACQPRSDSNCNNARTTMSSDPSSIPRATDSESGDSEPTRTLTESNNNSDNFITPVRNLSQMKKPQLCKEHGIHPTFGGPCIFQNEDSIVLNSSDEESEIQQKTVIETDCDSSYLSECVDDIQLSQTEDYMPMYDARSGHMRMLKRQTGHIQLKNVRNTNWDPIGLSESDIMLDMSRKHLSMEATRASIPDVSALSTPMLSDDELTINAGVTECKGRRLSPSSTLISLDPRPLSVSTNEDSPESTSTHGLPVPLNSPNITTSGSSSSRPNTDNYDYAEMPALKAKSRPPVPPPSLRNSRKSLAPSQSKSDSVFLVPAPPKPILPKSAVPSTRSRHRHNGTSSRAQSCQDSKSVTRSVRSARSLHSVPNMPTTRSSSRSHIHQRHEGDSGFSTQGSRSRRRQALAASSHFTISDNTGVTRTVVQHSAVARNFQHDRKKQIAKKLKQFNNTLHKEKSTGNLHIETLGHF